MFYVKVLIATDGSKEATTALETANRILSLKDRRLDVLCVVPKFIGGGRRKGEGNARRGRLMREITQILEHARANLPLHDGNINLLTETGSPSGVIVNKAEDYDLTVIGARGRGIFGANEGASGSEGAGEVGLGPVASRVAEHASEPVLIARGLRSEGGLRVLVAVDGSTASLRAVETLASLFDLSSAEICLMHVAETPWIEFGAEEEWVTYSEEDKENSETGMLEKELVREGDAILEQARDLLLPHRLSVSTRLDEGNPADEILSEVERGQYDLVVVGATGARDLKHRMLGSVSFKIAWNAPCSVLIVREPE
jgi:nucleotide-binding universal stress UspA family protein